jgi:threonine aldolase
MGNSSSSSSPDQAISDADRRKKAEAKAEAIRKRYGEDTKKLKDLAAQADELIDSYISNTYVQFTNVALP